MKLTIIEKSTKREREREREREIDLTAKILEIPLGTRHFTELSLGVTSHCGIQVVPNWYSHIPDFPKNLYLFPLSNFRSPSKFQFIVHVHKYVGHAVA
jgi:hypothetical protein